MHDSRAGTLSTSVSLKDRHVPLSIQNAAHGVHVSSPAPDHVNTSHHVALASCPATSHMPLSGQAPTYIADDVNLVADSVRFLR